MECYGKILVELVNNSGEYSAKDPRSFSHGVSSLKEYINILAINGVSISKYCEDLATICPKIVSDWSINMRYAEDSVDWNTEAVSDLVQDEMEAIIGKVIEMQVDGVIV